MFYNCDPLSDQAKAISNRRPLTNLESIARSAVVLTVQLRNPFTIHNGRNATYYWDLLHLIVCRVAVTKEIWPVPLWILVTPHWYFQTLDVGIVRLRNRLAIALLDFMQPIISCILFGGDAFVIWIQCFHIFQINIYILENTTSFPLRIYQ